MSMRDLSKNFEDKEFVKAYFAGVENGNDVTQKLNQDGATLNSPDLIARLVGWLTDAEGEADINATAQAEQQVKSMNLTSQQEESKESSSGEESSDGTTRTSGEANKPSGFSIRK